VKNKTDAVGTHFIIFPQHQADGDLKRLVQVDRFFVPSGAAGEGHVGRQADAFVVKDAGGAA